MRTLINKFIGYLNITKLFKKDSTNNLNTRFMHGINRISIFMFLICLMIMLFRFLAG
ncbi:MAG: DUF6728 family protein [Flavobacteriales bacterium]